MKNNSTDKINIFTKEFFSKYKKVLIIFGSGLLVVLFIIGLINFLKGKENDFSTDEVPGIKQNRNQEFLKEQEKDIKCTFDGKNSLLSYNIVNFKY